MTMLQTVSDADVLAAVAAAETITEETPAPATTPAAAPPAPTLDPAVLEAAVQAALAAHLTPYQAQIAQLQQQVTDRTAATPPAAALLQELDALKGQVRKLTLESLTDDEKLAYLEQEREQGLAALAQTAQAEQARAEAARRTQEAAASVEAQDAGVQQLNSQIFDDTILPAMLEIAAVNGISEADATKDLKAALVYPVRDAQGRLTGFDWGRYRKERTAAWVEAAKNSTEARAATRAGGDGARPSAPIPKGFDPWDPKYNNNDHAMLLAAVNAGGF